MLEIIGKCEECAKEIEDAVNTDFIIIPESIGFHYYYCSEECLDRAERRIA